ncbi:uncharacterized protein LOC130694058 [Daphnia carinata]|uniref:uncharacterized protein LOC130694058 n=1 Tax=Daphnia carinata TaxID=120202 RepID=UPI00257E32DB|nr:uncharacterized protein LOC130694058 [Daphnia carinata]XP_057373190.1 uncharacterized protein LOC130694058 [Daphnia carinata]XP_057373196.1 uncharacterized protein LOC130694058 [Daphnia carinata]XP_057373199.1 uncharacterized protein LOC130694058 [Daphnia carinata]XP_057373200.1 uncharacterized protein LOC130694058 [Daphnia carinata]XP_057373201.1 uncharacterized protein LOC130694058 [Daphnia carinata]XP_057373202.1 uncharacterized protein LOC130694058 [Daphnia carinata]XP_059351515.1 unc
MLLCEGERMGHNFCGTIRSFLLILAMSTCCLTAAPPDLQARVEQLEKNYVTMKEHLEAKIIDLETKVGRLEAKIEVQDSLLAVLEKGHDPLIDNVAISRPHRQIAILRTCHEINIANPSYPSGMYWIDPDGQGIGDPPIHVYCDMEAPEADESNWWFDAVKGTTSILHDSESEMDIGSCTEPGCYSRQIKYNASDVQIQALIQFSENCAQNIEYRCRKSLYKYNGTVYAWWYGKDGKRKEFPSSTNCVNLDDTEKLERDFIDERDTVPYTRFRFSNPFKGSGKHKVSRLRCHGNAKTVAMPRSCDDLWRIGHTLNGIYSVRGDKQIETVFCQFDKRSNERDFQKKIGYQDIKTKSIYFYVQKDKHFTERNVPLPFERSIANIGWAMDLGSGVFTAPVNGTYFFSFAGLAQFPMLTGPDPVPVQRELGANLYKNGGRIAISQVNKGYLVYPDNLSPITLQSTISLQAGDKVWIQIYIGISGGFLYGDRQWRNPGSHTHFNGWLLEEEI